MSSVSTQSSVRPGSRRDPLRRLSWGQGNGRPQQWSTLQAACGSALLFGVLETVLTYFLVSNEIGQIGNYLSFLTTGCYWDGILMIGIVIVCYVPLQCLVGSKSASSTTWLGMSVGAAIIAVGATLVVTLAKLSSYLTVLFFEQKSCSFFYNGQPANQSLGTCYSVCAGQQPSDISSCCCCGSFSMTRSNVTFVSGVASCDALFGPVSIHYAFSMASSALLFFIACWLLTSLLSLLCGCCGPSLASVTRDQNFYEERSALLASPPPSYSSIEQNTPAQAGQFSPPGQPVQHSTRDALSFDRGPPPNYRMRS